MRLGPFKSGLSHPVNLYYCSGLGDTSVVVLIVLCFGVNFCAVCIIMYVFIFLVKFG